MDFTITMERTELGNVIQGDDHLTYPINGFQINLLWTAKYKQIRRVFFTCTRSPIHWVTFWKLIWWDCLPGLVETLFILGIPNICRYHYPRHHHQFHRHPLYFMLYYHVQLEKCNHRLQVQRVIYVMSLKLLRPGLQSWFAV